MSTAISRSPRSALSSTSGLWATWAVTRPIAIAVLMQGGPTLFEINYYEGGIKDGSMVEYPAPSLLPLHLTNFLSIPEAFSERFIWLCLAMDALVAASLIHAKFEGSRSLASATRRRYAVWFWCLFSILIAPLFYSRLDIFPALLVGFAALFLGSRSRLSAFLLALATTVKLWPGVLAAGLVGRFNSKESWLRLGWFFGSLAAIVGAVAAFSGLSRVTSPLEYQDVRGLQVESVLATPFFIARFRGNDGYTYDMAPSKSYEIAGPGVDTALAWASALTVIMIGVFLAWAMYKFIKGGWTPRLAAYFFLSAIFWLLFTNKVFSPQYMIWVGPIVAMIILSPWEQERGVGKQRSELLIFGISVLTLIATALTTHIYPFNYGPIFDDPNWQSVAALTLRNFIVIVLTVMSTWLLISEELAGRREQPIESEPAPVKERNRPDWAIAGLVTAGASLVRFLFLATASNANGQSFSDNLKSWDGAHILEIANNGYFSIDDPSSSEHFQNLRLFPGYPFAVHVTHVITRLPYGFAAVLLSLLLLWALTIGIMKLARRIGASTTEATVAAIVATTGPMAIVLNMPFAQVLFIAAALWSLLKALDGKWGQSAALAFVASLTSPAAICLGLALILTIKPDERKHPLPWTAPAAAVVPTWVYLSWADSKLRDMGGLLSFGREHWGYELDLGYATVHWTLETLLKGDNIGAFLSAAVILAVPPLMWVTFKKVPMPVWVLCFGVGLTILLIPGVMHAKPRLFLPLILLLVPLAIAAWRKLEVRSNLALMTAWVIFGSWYSAYMLAPFPWAI